jgi:hypothetical protein
MMEEKRKFVGFEASAKEIALVEAVREKTDETTTSAVLRKALKHYAKAVKVPA